MYVVCLPFFPNYSSTHSCSLHRTQLRYSQGVFFLLGKFKSKGMFSFSFPKSTKPNFFQICVSDLCRLLGMTAVEKNRGLWNRVVGEVERDRGMGWRKRKRRRKSTRTWNSLTHPLALSLSLFHTQTQKRLTGWSFKALASLYPSSGVEFQCSISFFIGGLGRAMRLGQDECVFFQ